MAFSPSKCSFVFYLTISYVLIDFDPYYSYLKETSDMEISSFFGDSDVPYDVFLETVS